MSEPFKGVVNVDIRDSVPDWSPFEAPKAPEGAPNVLYIVLDDVGFSALGSYGGPIETPNIDRIVSGGLRYTQMHTTALCSPTRSCLLTGRNHTRNSMACITEAAIGFPNASGTVPPENGMLPEVLGADLSSIRKLDCPLILFAGRYDVNVNSDVAAEWFAKVKAPAKQFVWFENSAHLPMTEEPGRFLLSLVRYARPIAERAGDVAPAGP